MVREILKNNQNHGENLNLLHGLHGQPTRRLLQISRVKDTYYKFRS